MKFDDIFSCMDTIEQRDGRTDRQMNTGRQQRPRLRIASRGKNGELCVAVRPATMTDGIPTWLKALAVKMCRLPADLD